MMLKFQFRDLSLARASYDFTPGQKADVNMVFIFFLSDHTESNMLMFKCGEVCN